MITYLKIKKRLVFILILIATYSFSQSNKFKVTLDAGHGAHDFGAVYNGHIEKNITLALVLKVGKILEKNSNIDVIYTRKSDVFIDLVERANIANRADASIFVSIHCNANKNTVADGTETYVMGMSKNASNLEAAKRENQVITMEKDYKSKYEGYDPSKPESMLGMTIMQEEFLENSIVLAGKIQDRFVADLGKKSRGGGVKQAPYMVLHKAYMPRVLIETGFISNPVEGAKLDSEEGQQEVADAIAKAIIGYKKDYFDGGTSDYQGEKPSDRVQEQPTKIKNETKNTDSVKVDNSKKTDVNDNQSGIIFRVQLSASNKKVALNPSNFKGLRDVTIDQENSLYKYIYGETSNYEQAKTLLETAKSKGYKTAFLIAFKNGKNISVREAVSQN